MKRLAFKMYLFPGNKEEYIKRHNEIWPELKTLLQQAGIQNYSIFLDENTHELFGTLESHNQELYQTLPEHPIMKKWWDYMKDLMETNPDNSPKSQNLVEVFHLD